MACGRGRDDDLFADGVYRPFVSKATAPSPEPSAKPWAEGRILAQPAAGVDEEEFERILDEHGGRTVGKIEQINVHLVEVPPRAEHIVAMALANHPDVKFAEKDMLVPVEGVADDPGVGGHWHLPKIEAPAAWGISMGDGTLVAVLDTGVDGTHPELASRMVPGWNVHDNNGDTSDMHGHGTWVAGVVAGETDDGSGVASVACKALIMPVRISRPDGYAYWSTIARGITWAADHGARVANVGHNGVSGSASVQSAARYLRSQGGLVLVAAGDSGGQESIAESPDLITVSATTHSDTPASFSGYGESVDVAAPGVDIATTARGGGYATVSGTSFAGSCTAGVVALIMAANPALGPDQVESILFETADDLGSLGWDEYHGFGRINAAAAAQAALEAHAGLM